jgi:hypothetical protein
MPAKYQERNVLVTPEMFEEILFATADINDLKALEIEYYLFYPEDIEDGELVEIPLLFTPTQAKALDKYSSEDSISYDPSLTNLKAFSEKLLDHIEEELQMNEEELDLAEEILGEGIRAAKSKRMKRGGAGNGQARSLKKSKKMRSKMSKAQMREMKGRGFFADVGKTLTSVAADVVNTFAPGVGSLLKEPVDNLIENIDEAITGKGMLSKKDLRSIRKMMLGNEPSPSQGGQLRRERARSLPKKATKKKLRSRLADL